jgi:hypothetical protein
MSLAQRSVALQNLRAIDLDEQVRSSLTELSLLGRKASAEIRIRLLPMLDEVKRRYDQGETINKKKGYHEYIRSLGLTPSTVRSWKTRDHQRIVGDVLKSARKSKELEREEKKYERRLQDGIKDDVESAEWDREQEAEEKEFQRRLKEDPEFRRQQEEKERQHEEWLNNFYKQAHEARKARAQEHEPEFDWRQLLHRKNPPVADIREFASLGRREAARKYHPDRGGDAARMSQLNQVADWLEAIAGAA